ncbi:alpha-L-arabinofuranosidase [Paenibacillus castaneae]|uniref:alpha-L-arabinofuranosidase C-terminal domain-containing protein n=1 Tax=Paenibacillus castaneae TaxID=474957 RepID=UPI000C9CEEE9|nr:alpha-L-arabinofuranosidase C-terminal domain-containing protein [Paenibacillus castaneae]NIK79591.1 alpha-L-arabinofuranosidase [Paenibacillus castaneae]
MKNKQRWMICSILLLGAVAAAIWLLLPLASERQKEQKAETVPAFNDFLVLRYTFDMDAAEGAAVSEAEDQSGHDNGALLKGGKLVPEGRFGGGFELDGINAYAELPTAVLNGLEELTLSAWVNVNELRTWQRIFDFGNGTDRYLFLTPMSETGKVKIAIKNGGGEQIIDAATELPVDSWTHIAFTWTGSSGVLYLNGREAARNDELSIKPSDMAGTTSNFIGKSQFDVDPYLSGQVDEVRLYGKALAANEVADVLTDGMNDEEIVAFTSEWLELGGSERVVSALTLPSTGPGGSSVAWSSDNAGTVDDKGTVTRPASGAGDQEVILTAKISKGKAFDEKKIPLRVWEEGAADYAISIGADQLGAPVSHTLFGIFFEDINFAGDGGVYAELVENRSFEFSQSLWNWARQSAGDGDGTIEVRNERPLNANNPHYLTMQVNAPGADDAFAVANSGFGGMALKQGESYDFSLYARSGSAVVPKLHMYLEDDGGHRIGEAEIAGIGAEFSKHSMTITPSADALNGRLVLSASGVGELDVDMISLFPHKTWMNRPGGLRADLVQMLADLNPAFIRFPGGSIVGGDGIDNRYNWKDSIGDAAQRKTNENLWGGGALTTPYYQSYGLGFHEYFQLSEDLGAEPLPVVNAGMGDQFRHSDTAPIDELASYIQDALDLIEYANGSIDSEWGAKRAKNGHLAPFGLHYLAIGNEHWGADYFIRFQQFQEAIKKQYPDIELIASAGPSPAGPIFEEAWRWQQSQPTDIVDEHYYMNPDWFLSNSNRYDSYDRSGPKVFVGEYAAHNGSRSNNFGSALAEAAFMIGLERNSDVVAMASYAPLFGKEGYSQWAPDLIWFNNSQVFGTPNYAVQQMFGNHVATSVLPATVVLRNGQSYEAGRGGIQAEEPFYFIAGKDEQSGDWILKAVNAAGYDVHVDVQLAGVKAALQGTKLSLYSDDLNAENSFAEPLAVKPVEQAVDGLTNEFKLELPKKSITILRLKAKP